jgi:hypothetical protein
VKELANVIKHLPLTDLTLYLTKTQTGDAGAKELANAIKHVPLTDLTLYLYKSKCTDEMNKGADDPKLFSGEADRHACRDGVLAL